MYEVETYAKFGSRRHSYQQLFQNFVNLSKPYRKGFLIKLVTSDICMVMEITGLYMLQIL